MAPCALGQADLDKAIKHHRQALSIDPSHRGAHGYIGEAWLRRQQPENAREPPPQPLWR